MKRYVSLLAVVALVLAAILPARAGDEINAFGLNFRPPDGWKSRTDENVVLLGHDTIAGAILVLRHDKNGLDAVKAQMQQGLEEDDVELALSGKLSPFGEQGFAGTYEGTFQGAIVRARVIGLASPNGGGAVIIALTTPEQFGKALQDAADVLGKSMKFAKAEVAAGGAGGGDLVRHFAGTWVYMSANTTIQVVLAPNGEYSDSRESSYTGQMRDGGGNNTGNWGTAGQSSGRGRWSAKGTRERGVLTFVTPAGETNAVEYEVHVKNGRPLWDEVVIDGKVFCKMRQ